VGGASSRAQIVPFALTVEHAHEALRKVILANLQTSTTNYPNSDCVATIAESFGSSSAAAA